MVDSIEETTDDVAPHERWAYWKDTAMAAVDGASLGNGPFSASRSMTPLGPGLLVDTASGPLAARRTARNIARDGGDDACLMSLFEGHAVIDPRDDGAKALPAGELALFDLARPYSVTVPTAYREMRLYVPRAEFAARVGRIGDLAGLRIPADDILATLFSAYVRGLLAGLSSMTREQADAGLDGALHLLSNLVSVHAGVRRDEGGRMPVDAVAALAERHIAALLGDRDLDVAKLAAAIGLSRTRLYKAFEDRGGVATVIRDMRLDRARRRLLERGPRPPTVQQVAHECGFSDYATFARAFRRRFGMSARDWRNA